MLRRRAGGEDVAYRAGGGSVDGAKGAVQGVVAVFAEGTPAAEIERVVGIVRPDVVQMTLPALSSSKEPFSPGLAVWNTICVGRDGLTGLESLPGDALHFDTAVEGLSGGTGKTFDWSVLGAVPRSRPVVLAGGLTPANVRSAVRSVKPDVVDVSSGVESAPGIKDASKIAAFLAEVRRA